MLRVSKLADYATVVMAYMARELNQLHNARDIALNTHIALPTVSKILKLMSRKGLLVSLRGIKGGYKLARGVQEITVAQIVSAVDGDLAITACSHQVGHCSLESLCHVRTNWQVVSFAILQTLDALTLADFVKPINPRHFFRNMHEINHG